MPSLTLITFPYLINFISLLSVLLWILISLAYCSTDMTCRYCGPVLSIQFRAASCLLTDCPSETGEAWIMSLSPPSSWMLSSSTLAQYSHFLTKSPPSTFDLSLPYSLMQFLTYILLPVTACFIFTACLVSILFTGIITAHGGIKKNKWYNKFVRDI